MFVRKTLGQGENHQCPTLVTVKTPGVVPREKDRHFWGCPRKTHGHREKDRRSWVCPRKTQGDSEKDRRLWVCPRKTHGHREKDRCSSRLTMGFRGGDRGKRPAFYAASGARPDFRGGDRGKRHFFEKEVNVEKYLGVLRGAGRRTRVRSV